MVYCNTYTKINYLLDTLNSKTGSIYKLCRYIMDSNVIHTHRIIKKVSIDSDQIKR